jgi:hypothetical protein
MKTRPNLGITGSVQTLSQSSTKIIASVADAQLASRSNNWPQLVDFIISPAFNSKSSWTLSNDGPLNITTGTYTIIPQKNVTVNLKMWGEGGAGGASGGGSSYPSGAGAALTGNVTLTQGSSYYITFFGRGTSPAAVNSNGGNAAGIFVGTSATQAGAVAIAAGGGGAGYDDGNRGDVGGAGGFPSGANGAGYSNAYGRGASNTAGGAAGTASNLGTAGSALQGGTGASSGTVYGGGGGGGGYFGGGGAAIQASWAGAGGGGGSSYANTSLVTGLTHYSGSGTTAGNASDTVRNGAGSGVSAGSAAGSAGGTGRIYISSL